MPKIIDRDAQRREILLGAFPLFASRGYEGLSMRAIAQELKVSTGTLYHYFENKESLFQGLAEVLSAQHLGEALEVIDLSASLEARIEGLFAYTLEQVSVLQQILQIALDLRRSGGDDAPQILVRATRLWRAIVGEVLGPDGKHLATQIFHELLGLVSLSLLDPEALPTPEELRSRALPAQLSGPSSN